MPRTQKFLTTAALLATMTSFSYAEDLNIFLSPSPSATAIESFIPAYEKKSGNKVHVTEVPYGEMHQKLMLSVQLKQGQYDVAQFDNSFLTPFGAAGVMSPLDDMMSDPRKMWFPPRIVPFFRRRFRA